MGSELVYDVSIGSLTKNVVSSTSTFTVYLEATSRHLQTCTKAGSWVTPATLALTYDIRNPPASTTLTSVAYIGPGPDVSCATPEVTIIDSDGVSVAFLSAAYNQ